MFSEKYMKELIESATLMISEGLTRLDTAPYETINDESPKGYGIWSFGIDAYPQNPFDYEKLEKSKMIVDINDKYENAVKKIMKDNPTAKIIYLLP